MAKEPVVDLIYPKNLELRGRHDKIDADLFIETNVKSLRGTNSETSLYKITGG